MVKQDPRLGRIPQFDERSKQFRAIVGLERKPLRSYTWSCGVVLDQGREGACVGFAWAHELAARPHVYSPVTNDLALNGYKRARQLDEWPGEDYSGTSVLAGVKAFSEILNADGLPVYGEYRWAFGVEDVLRVAGYKGPLVLGINWYENMYEPDSKGMVSVSGEVVGGHAILLNGVKIVKNPGVDYAYSINDIDKDKSLVKLHNSWGSDYGINGECRLTVSDLETLLDNDGEACIPVVRRA